MPSLKQIVYILALVLILSALSLPQHARAQEVIGVNLIVNNFLNNSTAKALSWLVFDSSPKPNPDTIDNLTFEWWRPDGSLAFIDEVDPDVEAVAWSFFKVDMLGTWNVNVSYQGNLSIFNNKSFDSVPDHWGPGIYYVNRTTLVSRDAVLTIEAGTIVAFDTNKSLGVEGKIVAEGTSVSPIKFTSNLTNPAPGDWGSITLYNSTDNTSVLDYIEMEYSREGLILNGASVNVTNSMFVNNREVAIHAILSKSVIKGNYIERGDPSISPFGIISAGSNLTIQDNDIHFMGTGIYLLNTNDTTIDNLVMDSDTLGMFVVDSILNSTRDRLIGNWHGVKLDHSTAVFENLTIVGFKEGFAAFQNSEAVLFNSSVQEVEVITFELAQGSSVNLINTTFGTFFGKPGITIEENDNSTLAIQNFLTVEVISHDNGTHIVNASVVISDALGPIYLTTGQDGLTPTVACTDKLYMPTAVDLLTFIEISYPNMSFQDNNRGVDMDSSRIEVFEGSVYDLDKDGEPDFSDDDMDGDNLLNEEESVIGTNPMDPDSDDDGLPDGFEADYPGILDPLSGDDAYIDSDNDGLSNLDEFMNGTFPDNPDSDSDKLDDLIEIECGLDPLNETDADADWDNDSHSNGKECRLGTDMMDPDDYPIEEGLDPMLLIIAVLAVVAILILVLFLLRRRPSAAEEVPPDEKSEEPVLGKEIEEKEQTRDHSYRY